MNKKFSTLLAGAALVAAVSANAQNLADVKDGVALDINKSAQALPTYDKDTKGGLYQLRDANDQILMMKEVNGEYSLVAMSANDKDFVLKNTLWCVTTQPYSQGQAVKFDFMNKGTGMMLDIAMGDDLKSADGKKGYWWKPIIGGEISGWAFSSVLNKLEKNVPLYSHFSTDSVIGLLNDNGTIKVAKYALNDVKVDPTAATDVTDLSNLSTEAKNTFSGFTLYQAEDIVLDADQLNKIFDLQDADAGVKLNFSPDVKGTSLKNPFNEKEFIAESTGDNKYYDVNASSTATLTNGEWLYVTRKNDDNKDTYLKVDTAYTNETGAKFLAYGWTGPSKTQEAIDRLGDLQDQHKFLFVYSPSKDELKIYVKKITWRGDDDKVKYWKEIYQKTDNQRNNWRVSLQDLIKDETRILTVDYSKQNTTIKLGYGGCEADQSKTSVKDGVYYIMNKKGEYLASPIYENGVIRWTTVNADEQNVAHMPAYQWVVLKTNAKDQNNLSSVTATNREFDDAKGTFSLYKNADTEYVYTKSNVELTQDGVSSKFTVAAKSDLRFVEVPAEAVSDSLLGYKNLTNDELKVNKYTVNYWHPYATDKYIAKSSKDSTLTVNVGVSAFNVDTAKRSANSSVYAVEKFGFKVEKEHQDRIKGLKQLYRTAYVVKLNGIGLAINKEDKFNVPTHNDYRTTGENEEVTPFFFKENNEIKETGKCYYAILSTEKDPKDVNDVHYSISDDNKAGVSDYDGSATLKSQVLKESRTSAFAIEPDETPLYRRFNSLELEGNEGDKADTLRFIEKYRKEYLQVENNKNFMNGDIDFLGIYTPDKTEDGLSFIVDTAWVNRGAGNIKPQYLISIDRNDFEGTPGVACTYTHNHYDNEGNKVDAAHCSHATPAIAGFERGKYLINFHDFALKHDKTNTSDAKKDAAYMWKKYDRAGFVEAVRVADTLFILRDEFKNLKNEEITIEALNKAEEAAWAAAKKAGVSKDNFVSYKYVLSGDNHKYVTWSMRFVDRNAAANEVEADRSFLFESMQADGLDIAPTKAAWLKMQNGCLVLSDKDDSKFDETATGGDDALIFNVEQGDDIATDNETIDAVEGVSITTDNGTVTIQGAAGKSVVISNILGKVVAETVLTSDNATIAVPAGIVAVAVDGEEAVKVVVK